VPLTIKEVEMPWHVESDKDGCDGFAVVKDDDGSLEGCHDTQEDADAQVAALYGSESPKEGEPGWLLGKQP
jgi:hypothetical protein